MPSAAPVLLRLAECESPVGGVTFAVTERDALCALGFTDRWAGLGAWVEHRFGGRVRWVRDTDPAGITRCVHAYFAGELRAIDDLALDPGGTPFQQRVWTVLRATVPAGRTISYGELARALDLPHASRAVGAANGANPICLVIPCHRVIGSNGQLTGYGGGLHRKEWLLGHEGIATTRPLPRVRVASPSLPF